MKAKVIESTTINKIKNIYDTAGLFKYIGPDVSDVSIIVLLDVKRTKQLASDFFAGTVVYESKCIHEIGSYHTNWAKELFERINEPLAIEYYD
jgi:hypothetical protein